jgi:hypothetical protein
MAVGEWLRPNRRPWLMAIKPRYNKTRPELQSPSAGICCARTASSAACALGLVALLVYLSLGKPGLGWFSLQRSLCDVCVFLGCHLSEHIICVLFLPLPIHTC